MIFKPTLTALALTTIAAHAAVVVNYTAGVSPTAGTTGAADPTTQGWGANAGAGTTAFSHGLDSTNGGWRITDGTGGAPFFYQGTIGATDAAAMATGDWTATWTTAVNADAINSGGGGVDSFYDAPDNGRQNDNAMWIELAGGFRYIMTYNVDANNDIQLNDGTSVFQITTANNQLSEEIGASVANYITFTLASVGGVTSLTDSLGGSHGAVTTAGAGTIDRVVWGATSSGGLGSTTWNAINIETVPEPSTAILLGLGGLGLLLRRRR